jgi:hypothetical protein
MAKTIGRLSKNVKPFLTDFDSESILLRMRFIPLRPQPPHLTFREIAEFFQWDAVGSFYSPRQAPPFDPRRPLTGLALRLLAVSNALHQ